VDGRRNSIVNTSHLIAILLPTIKDHPKCLQRPLRMRRYLSYVVSDLVHVIPAIVATLDNLERKQECSTLLR